MPHAYLKKPLQVRLRIVNNLKGIHASQRSYNESLLNGPEFSK